MISKQAVDEQLRRIGCNIKFWGRAEVNELGRILLDDEIIAECVNGEYTNGFALLVATNHRVLVVDKKPMMYLTVEDLRFDLITEFNYSHRLMNATISIHTVNKAMTFTSWNRARLRRLLEYTQQRVLEMRQQAFMAQQFQAAAAAQYAQLHAANYYQPMPNYSPNLALEQPRDQQAQEAVPPPQSAVPVEECTQPAPAPLEAAQPAAALPPQSATAAADTPPLPASASSRFAAKRGALGTYTRSKLPSFRYHADRQDADTQPGRLQSGEVYPEGYKHGRPVTDYGMPYQY